MEVEYQKIPEIFLHFSGTIERLVKELNKFHNCETEKITRKAQ